MPTVAWGGHTLGSAPAGPPAPAVAPPARGPPPPPLHPICTPCRVIFKWSIYARAREEGTTLFQRAARCVRAWESPAQAVCACMHVGAWGGEVCAGGARVLLAPCAPACLLACMRCFLFSLRQPDAEQRWVRRPAWGGGGCGALMAQCAHQCTQSSCLRAALKPSAVWPSTSLCVHSMCIVCACLYRTCNKSEHHLQSKAPDRAIHPQTMNGLLSQL